jgi:hypothetical protein
VIGLKSLAALATVAVAIAASRDRLEAGYLASLSAATCIAVGAIAALAAALLAVGWRPSEPSRIGLGLGGLRAPGERSPRELPGSVQRALFTVAFACAALAAFTDEATERLVGVPAALVGPSPSGTCPEPTAAPAVEAPALPPPEVPGCALIRRAYQLGYAKSLGSCAPDALAAAPAPVNAPKPPCTLRQRDEPALHFAWRRLLERTDELTAAHPVDTVAAGARSMRIKLDHLDALVAHAGHAVAATRHASHHLWLNLPAPAGPTGLRALIEPPRCAERYDRAQPWPEATGAEASALVDHVVGQLLFAPGFGVVPTQCGDYGLHWDAAADACQRLLADPAGFLASAGALESVRDVLDRRRRRLELGELDRALGRRPTVAAPPEARALVSLHCFIVDPAIPAPALTGRDIEIDGQLIGVRELRVPSVRLAGAGPIDVYAQVARLLAGSPLVGPEPPPLAPAEDDLAEPGYLLTRLDPLRDADPFAGARWPLERPDLVEVHPVHLHLHRFVDGFRRRYWAERGRL